MLGATPDAGGLSRPLTEDLGTAWIIAHESAILRNLGPLVHGRQPQRYDTLDEIARSTVKSGLASRLSACAPPALAATIVVNTSARQATPDGDSSRKHRRTASCRSSGAALRKP